MDVFDVLLQVGLITSAIVAYLLVFRRQEPWKGKYRTAGWNYPLKLLYAKYTLYWWKRRQPPTVINQDPNNDQREGLDEVNLRLTSPDGAAVLLSIRKICGRKPLAEITVFVKLSDGTTYVLPQHPQTLIGAWEKSEDEWKAGGLKIQILEPLRWRVIYNGLLRRTQDNVVLHAKLNLIWVSGSSMVLHPDDWSAELAAEALAVTPWRDGNWPDMLIKHKEISWLQYGAAQGRFLTFDPEGNVDTSEYLRVRGARGRAAARGGHTPVRRQVVVTAVGEDGTMVTMKCVAYKNGLTQCISGSVRQPGYQVEPITGTDLMMADFYETPITVVNNYSINVSTKSRSIRMTLRMNDDGGELTSGTDQQLQILYKTFTVEIDGFSGSGILELGYETTVAKEPSYPLTPAPLLKWVSKTEAGDVGFCVSFEERGAACADYVGGKGASLALLASVQKEEGYKVPPGFCLTIKALDHFLEQNPQIMKAIEDIEASNENYDENVFKQKCEKASSMFLETEIAGNLKNDILTSMAALRTKALEEIGGDLRFAVRSSAVGEDSEVLSAAGQNETILGCVSDEDVLIGVQKCWASMFAFTSAFYRRENGQACYCGGGVVVQTLARARAAGVMFSRHPAAGDPARVLVTANYGLGESVVSGSVEPDTFIVRRNGSDLTIASSIIGAKKQRINVAGNGVGVVDVPEGEQSVACLGAEEVLRLAAVGGRQELLWGAGRDVEWAFVENDLYLLQARPITSLERWTEEELLHEADDPVMADDELTSFGNAGEVLPRPLTALSNDIVKIALTHNFDKAVDLDPRTLEHSIVTTHYRCALALYSSIYKQMPKEIDTGIRMVEMAVHGHKVADDAILATALHRRKPRLTDKLKTMTTLLKSLLTSKRSMDNSIKESTAMGTGEHIDDISEMLTFIDENNKILQSLSSYHSVTSTASSASQIIAMSILLEGGSEFSPEVCNEISSLLSSGDVLSAEVPQSLARLARRLEASGRYDEFRREPRAHAFRWLEEHLPEVHGEVCDFLKHHGHRAFMEFELATMPWVLVPEDMMKVLQNLRASKEEEQVTKSDNEIIAALESPQKASTRKVLRWVLPLCRRTVRHREATKAALILGVHRARLAARRLARLLARRWLVPRDSLVFHFRRHELQRYLATRDPALLRKAIQRSQYHPGWCKLKFSEINRGWVLPQEDKGPLVTAGDVKIQAASVCGGEVIARACVVNDLSEIDQLQQGDILITHATDIGWSPYFPLITGIVTELGGLISHGAVIAREYGLPCIVGAARATELFRTGDTVRLSGARGAVERVQLLPAAAPTDS